MALYICEGDEHSVCLSAHSVDSPEWENNHWEITDNHSHSFKADRRLPASTLLNCLTNVFRQAGIDFIQE